MADNHMHDIATGKLYRALLRLMDEKPFSEISVSELSHRAGTSRMAFYRNYKSIGGILLYLNDYPQDSDPEQLADMVLSMVAGDAEIEIKPS